MTTRIHSQNFAQSLSRWSIVVVAISAFACGLAWRNANLLGVGAAILCFILRRAWDRASNETIKRPHHGNRKRDADRSVRVLRENEGDRLTSSQPDPVEELAGHDCPPKSTDSLVDELLAGGRYALMLRPETKQHLTQFQLMRAIRQLDEAMALVPAGRVLIGQLAEMSNSACCQSEIDPKLTQRNLIMVAPIYLDRFSVTNAEYQKFIDAGGYEQLEFWHEESLPALLDFVDQT